MNIIILILILLPSALFAGPAACPDYAAPSTVLAPIQFGAPPYNVSSPDQYCTDLLPRLGSTYATNYTFNNSVVASNGAGTCYLKSKANGTIIAMGSFTYYTVCPTGYVKAGTHSYSNPLCNLSNGSLVDCPPCVTGQSVGKGGASAPLVCLNGCEIKSKGLSAADIDSSGNEIGIKLSEWEQTGGTCTVGGTLPIANNIDPSKPNCISNGARQLCIGTNPQKPGCGTVNGVEWCPEKHGCGEINGVKVCVPEESSCIPVGGGDYACTKNASPRPPPQGEALPIADFKVKVPVQDGNGSPAGGLLPSSNGGVPGPGTVNGEIGHYPGPTGNGATPGGGGGSTGGGDTIDTSGLATSANQGIANTLLGNIKDSLSGSLSGAGFSTGTTTVPAQTDISPEIASKRLELSDKLASIKAEYQQIITFGSSGASGGNLQCPPDAGFSFMGTSISLCTQSILNSTAAIGNVLIFLAAVVALYILLS